MQFPAPQPEKRNSPIEGYFFFSGFLGAARKLLSSRRELQAAACRYGAKRQSDGEAGSRVLRFL